MDVKIILNSAYLQHGSYFIQQHMETATDGEKQEIFTELLPSASFLMTDPFGNYVIQKFFEFGSPHQVQILCSLLRGNVVTLSFQMFGCRVVQKAIESLAGDDQVCVCCVCVCVRERERGCTMGVCVRERVGVLWGVCVLGVSE